MALRLLKVNRLAVVAAFEHKHGAVEPDLLLYTPVLTSLSAIFD